MASTCTLCHRIIVKTQRQTRTMLTKTVTINGHTMPIEYPTYQHQDCPSE